MSSSSDDDKLIPSWIFALRPLTKVGTLGTLIAFAKDPREFILDIIREEVVIWVLTAWSFLLETVSRFGEMLLVVYLEGIATPFRESFVPLGSAIFDSFAGIQEGVAESLVGMGVGAPLALLFGFAIATVSYVIIFAVLWSVIDTYLPAGAIVRPIKAIVSMLSFGRFGESGEERSKSGGSGGETNDQ